VRSQTHHNKSCMYITFLKIVSTHSGWKEATCVYVCGTSHVYWRAGQCVCCLTIFCKFHVLASGFVTSPLPPPHLATDLISAQIRNSDRSLVLEKGKTQAGTVRAVERYAILKRVVKCGFLTDSQAVTQIMPLDRVFGQSVSRLHLIGDMWLFYLGYSIGKLKLI